ncbi:MAG TPA: alpha/beta hydrolase [Candidatus Fournierella merdavium]|uniref:alpha/beta hydrolase family protein n=1 Tax=Candidatus Allofournierella merdavium TaxID=2838593 RepID=UPI001F9F7AF6|nr:alpha/beta hydrolase [Candidatus Fournierella merdavium]
MLSTDKTKRAKIFVCIAIVLMLISMIGASLIQTSGGRVKVDEVNWVDTDGIRKTALLLVPENATVETPAPAIVTSHGFLNNKEMQDLNYVELARRGYVVLAIDMASHGDSQIAAGVANMMPSVWQGVLFLADIGYVDTARIGVTGHSFGGFSSNFAVTMDNAAGTNLISAVLVNSMDPTYDSDSDGVFDNVYGGRDVGVVAGEYDEFGFTILDENGVKQPKPDYIHSAEAQSFLYYGTDRGEQPEREANTVYTQEVDGQEAMRVIYTSNIIHPWSHFSARSTTSTIEFFEQALGAPNPIPATNQIWQWKTVFNVVGIVGFVMFAINCAIALLATPFFQSVSSLGAEQTLSAPAFKGKKWWFWVSLVISAVVGSVIYLPIMLATKSATYERTFLNQAAVRGVSTWAMACGVVTLVLLLATKAINKDAWADCAAKVRITPVRLLKTVLLAITVVAASYAWVFIADYFFHVDFRIWVLAIKRFNPVYLFIAIPFMIMGSVFYIMSSISVNCFNYCKIGGKEWVNTLILALFTGAPAFILTLMQYIYFYQTGYLLFAVGESALFVVWLFPLVAILPISVLVSRKIYKACGNPYLAGVINAVIVALISSANTCTFY